MERDLDADRWATDAGAAVSEETMGYIAATTDTGDPRVRFIAPITVAIPFSGDYVDDRWTVY